MKFIVVSDLHLNVYYKYSHPLKGRYITNTNIKHEFVVLDRIFRLAIKYHAAVVFNGDVFDQRGHVDTRIMDLAMQAICRFSPRVSIYFNTGNHDQLDNSRVPVSSLDVFRNVPNVTVIDKPTLCHRKGVDLAFVPYSDDVKWLKAQIKTLASKVHKPALEFFHLGIAGSKNTSHLVKLSGAFSLENLVPQRYDYVIGGHYHLRQKLGPNAWYVGSTIPHEHADDDQVKGVDLVSITPEQHSHQFIPLKSPQFYTFDLAQKTYSREAIAQVARNSVVKVIAHHQTDAQWYLKHTNCEVDDETPAEYHNRLDLKSTATPVDIVRKYCQKYYDKATTRKAIQILEKVKNK